MASYFTVLNNNDLPCKIFTEEDDAKREAVLRTLDTVAELERINIHKAYHRVVRVSTDED